MYEVPDPEALRKDKIARRSTRLLVAMAIPTIALTVILGYTLGLGSVEHVVVHEGYTVTTTTPHFHPLGLLPGALYAYLLFVRITKSDPLRLYRAMLPAMTWVLQNRTEIKKSSKYNAIQRFQTDDSPARGIWDVTSGYYTTLYQTFRR